jgi:hypothetical protein
LRGCIFVTADHQLRRRAIRVLKFVEHPVETMLRQQLLMPTLFPDLAMVQHDNLIGSLDC